MIRSRHAHDIFAPSNDPAWRLIETGHAPPDAASRAARFAVSNGFLGIRAAPPIVRGQAKDQPARTIVSGLFDTDRDGNPALAAGPDWIELRLRLRGEALDREAPFQMTLDLRRGVLLTDERHAVGRGSALRIRSLLAASLAERPLALQVVELEAEGEELEVELEADWGRAAALIEARQTAGCTVWETHDANFSLAVAASTILCGNAGPIAPEAEGPFHARWRWRMQRGDRATLTHARAMARQGVIAGNVEHDVQTRLDATNHRDWATALADHEAAWAERWRDSEVEVGGDAATQEDLSFALYHLIGAANPADDRVSIAARGLTGGDYKGHVFWDTEIYLLPFYTLTDPAAARTLLMYRFHTLDGAREKARRLGWRGALYAWESAANGEEATPEHAIGPDGKPVDILAGKQEQHVSADVAYAAWRYRQATGDDGFWLEAGAEVLLETGRFWASRAKLETDGRRHIRGVIGPDEYHSGIDDNAYTNVMARWTIERALETAQELQQRWPDQWGALRDRIALDAAELDDWREAAATIVDGFDPDTGLYEQFAGYFDLEHIDLADYAGRTKPLDVLLGPARTQQSQIIKQADVVELLAVLPAAFPGRSARANFRYYEPRCGHGSSLSRVTHGLVAARLGMADAALAYFRDAAAIDLLDSQGAIGGGVHIAGLGGLWMIAVFGFGGLSVTAEGISLDPQLPAQWSSLTFRIQWRGRRVKIGLDGAGAVEATLEAGEAAPLAVRGRDYTLSPGQPLRVEPASTADPAALDMTASE